MATKPAEVVPFEAPEVKTDLKPIRAAASEVLARAKALTHPRSEAQAHEAAAALGAIKTHVIDPAEKVRKHLNEPIAEAKRRNDVLIRETLTVDDVYLPDLEGELRSGITTWGSREYERESRRAEKGSERLQERIESADGGPVVVPFIPGASPKRTLKTAEGMVILGAKLKFKVSDPDALPAHCKHEVPNEKVIEGLLAAGQDVPGVTAVYQLNTTVRGK